ncbi:hypothetical protein AXF42_Ash018289 [Apostasia shenzhenica]|uniref:Histidine kinase/HSP90-like ATPase domain-containing protein n=1 Tax=Apostasia shenzhenica TaxID=1088818 RepID=A0A2I0B2Q7_9ASPA|nr:hypothetical protein AXF42_Ash018289 [Apostasia shenzhenica]
MAASATTASCHFPLSYDRPARLRPVRLRSLLPAHCRCPFKPSFSLSTPQSTVLLHRVCHQAATGYPTAEGGQCPSSSVALATAIRRYSPASQIEFTHKAEKFGKSGLLIPSPDFKGLCNVLLDLFRAVVDPHALLSVYVRPAGSYVMDRLELHRITCSPGVEVLEGEECVILVGNFAIPAGLHAAEIAISKQEVAVIAEHGAIVFPMVKHPFVVGFLVAEIPEAKSAKCDDHRDDEILSSNSPSDGANGLPPHLDTEAREFLKLYEELDRSYGHFTTDKMLRAIMISRSLATVYVMDQKAVLFQQTSWQNNIRMGHLVEQIHGSLSSIRTLSQMLSTHVKRSEVAYDIIEDIVVQSRNMKDALQKLQDAVHLTKANIIQFNEDSLQKIHDSLGDYPELSRHFLSNSASRKAPKHYSQDMNSMLPLNSGKKDIVVPMPPLFLAPLQEHNVRPSCVSEMLKDLVGAAVALASKQQRTLEIRELFHPLLVAVDQSTLRQALSNLIEGSLLRTRIGGKVEIFAVSAPAGGALIVIDDDGPDMHYMTQVHSLTPYGADLLSDGNVEDNMTWNFVAGLTIAREILEAYGCVVHVISPRELDAALGAGGTRIELWLPFPSRTMGSSSHDSSREL